MTRRNAWPLLDAAMLLVGLVAPGCANVADPDPLAAEDDDDDEEPDEPDHDRAAAQAPATSPA